MQKWYNEVVWFYKLLANIHFAHDIDIRKWNRINKYFITGNAQQFSFLKRMMETDRMKQYSYPSNVTTFNVFNLLTKPLQVAIFLNLPMDLDVDDSQC